MLCYPYSTNGWFTRSGSSNNDRKINIFIRRKECDKKNQGVKVPRLTRRIIEIIKQKLWHNVLVFCYLFLVMTLWVRSKSARLDFVTSSSLFSGRESIAAAARLACFTASSLVLCIPRLFPRYSRACNPRYQPTNKKLTR